MRITLLLFVLIYLPVFAQTDRVNYTDTLTGFRQGKWQLMGSDVPEFGIDPSVVAEEGQYQNNQKVGPWIRYNKDGSQAISLIIYEFNPKGKESTRVSIFSYKYHPNGKISYMPYAGQCKTKANYKRFDTTGTLIELMEYDSLGNEIFSITTSDETTLSQMSYFQIPDSFNTFKEAEIVVPSDKKDLTQDGYYLLDYGHTKFISGKFQNGILVEGKECVLDETYALVSARTFKGSQYIASFKP